MNESEIKKIESKLDVTLPKFYRNTMLNYPFPADSYTSDFVISNHVDFVLRCNQEDIEYPGIGKPFVIGCDIGNEIYLIDLASESSQVFTFYRDSGKCEQTASDWDDYLAKERNLLKVIEKAEQERKANKKWWEFWK